MSNKFNKRARSSSSNDYSEQYTEYNINFTLNSSLNVLICEKKNELERNTYLETEYQMQ